MLRLFFALWPDDAAAGALERLAVALQSRAGGRAVPREKIHITLAFLGQVAADRADDLVQAAGSVDEAAFELVLDKTGAFRRARVAWAGASDPPAALIAAQSRLQEGLLARGFALEERPFAPHVTLVRKTERALRAEPVEPIAWRVDEMTLVRSDTGAGTYTVMARWPLRGRRGGS
jgi:RNA 2',3'-cyclic 3'-phosphodiesterase